MITLYICDGKKEDCAKTYCQYSGAGKCKRTMSELNAKYGVAEQITTDRFQIHDDIAVEIDRDEVMKNDEA